MIVVPVIFFSLVTGGASLDVSRLGKVGVKIMAFYLATSAFAVVIGLIFASVVAGGFLLALWGAR
jgi:Na+/H+-dicarboxylate symporter